jgi:hypothetical protein
MNQRGSISWRYAAGIAVVGVSLIVVMMASSYSAAKPTTPGTPLVKPYTAGGNGTLAAPTACASPVVSGSTCFTYTGNLRGTAPGPINASISGDLAVGSSGGTTPEGGVCSPVNGDMTITGRNGKFRDLTIDFVGTQCDTGAAPPSGTTGPTILNGSFATTGGSGPGTGAGTITISNDGSNNLMIVLNGALQVTGTPGGPSPSSSASPSPTSSASP